MARLKTSAVPTDPTERKAWIKYQLDRAGSSFAEIGREGKASRQTVRKVLDMRYPKWERLIASKLGMTPADIWPERYAA